ncbi:MAG TPA: 2-phospho-L-lactate transferase [Thermomicrobiales bacterium]|nr:2-phospho-L-lactate transferase [Thermomicrobiales bacterium]
MTIENAQRREPPMIVALAGGVGGAKLAQGLAALAPHALTVVVNTADDFDLYGLRICPDLDTVLYTLAGIADPANGWGIAGDTTATLEAIARLGRDPWFKLGDRDLATHIVRTERLRGGAPLSTVTAELAAALGVRATILPMTDDPVATMVETPTGTLPFQDYFVLRRQTDEVIGVTFAGIERAAPAPGVLGAIAAADAILFCPSNPFVSLGPILAVPGLAAAVAASPAPVVAVSPIVGGQAIKGPAAKMFASLGVEPSALAVARHYAGQIDGLAIDEVDAAWAPAIAALGIRPLVTRTVMGGLADRTRLAAETVAFAAGLAPVGSGA